ncbi:MAG TPA: SemiSWEET family transporter [Candidatus Limnocylindrales bacterium]|nr:SemiSWEET family transporter [Candidatus Limnocylindrales bacterium]
MLDLLGLGAASWGALMALAPMLQVRRIIARRSSADVSLGYLSVLEIGFVLWIAYGIALGSPVLVVPNVLAALIGAFALLVSWRYRGTDPGRR